MYSIRSMKRNDLIDWLLSGDVSIQYQVYRDLLDSKKKQLRDHISTEGWGARFLQKRNKNGHWGRDYYQPKWTSTHYTLLDLKNLGITPVIKEIKDTLSLILKHDKGPDGGINPSRTIKNSDICMNGMFLNFPSYFGAKDTALESVVDFILSQHIKDGGFNCHLNRTGAVHSSLHSTLSLIEGIREYALSGYEYRVEELMKEYPLFL